MTIMSPSLNKILEALTFTNLALQLGTMDLIKILPSVGEWHCEIGNTKVNEKGLWSIVPHVSVLC